jgi:hypothetical protein
MFGVCAVTEFYFKCLLFLSSCQLLQKRVLIVSIRINCVCIKYLVDYSSPTPFGAHQTVTFISWNGILCFNNFVCSSVHSHKTKFFWEMTVDSRSTSPLQSGWRYHLSKWISVTGPRLSTECTAGALWCLRFNDFALFLMVISDTTFSCTRHLKDLRG